MYHHPMLNWCSLHSKKLNILVFEGKHCGTNLGSAQKEMSCDWLEETTETSSEFYPINRTAIRLYS